MSTENKKSIFIGARTLKKEEVKIIVPTFDNIMSRVEDIRIEAHKKHNEDENKDKEDRSKYIKKYNNTITLFGNRGTGKTSTMYTIINELSENKIDILLEIIEPDNIGSEGKIIGCVLGLFKDEIDKLQNEIKNKNYTRNQKLNKYINKNFFDDCRFIENNPLKQAYDEVLEYYCYTDSEYKKLLTCNYNDMNSYIKKSSHILNADIKFAKKFERFIEKFIECKKYFANNGEALKCNQEPLIFIFIDDVDLNTNKCQEIIEAILRYASHPNIICFITGDYNTFTEEFIISLLKRENLRDSNLWPSVKINNENTILKSKQELAHEYMKKVFPPAYRHYVNTWDLSLIPQYRFDIDMNEKRENLFQLLSKISKYRNVENIFGYNSENENKIVYFLPAYNMFDRTSRGLINVYYSLNNIHDNLKNYDSDKYFVSVKGIIENIIDSSSLLVKYNQEIKNKYILWGSDEKQSKIDFEQLENLFKDDTDKEGISSDEKKIEIKYSLFYICYYISILLPDIQFLEEKRKAALKLATFELISNPKLNGYDTNVECDDTTERYFLNDVNYNGYHHKYSNYAYSINYMLFVRDMLLELNLEFSQKFYKNIVNSKLLGYEFFDKNYEMNEEKYNSLYKVFHKSLYGDETQDLNLLTYFYTNEKLNSYVTFLELKSNEEKASSYIEIIFKDVFQAIDRQINEKANQLKDSKIIEEIIEIGDVFLNVLKLQFKKLLSGKYNSIVSNSITEDIKFVVNKYNEGISKKIHDDYIAEKEKGKDSKEKISKITLDLSKLLYKTHENEIEENFDNKKENLYTNSEIFNKITELMIEVNLYELVDTFFYNIYKDIYIPNSIYAAQNERILNFNLSDDKISTRVKEFLNSYSGATYTIADEYKNEFRRKYDENIDNEGNVSLTLLNYYQLRGILCGLLDSNARYCKGQARELIRALDNNVNMTFNANNDIFTEEGMWIVQAYSLFIQKANSEVMDISELEETKTYLRDILPKVKEKQIEKEKEFSKRFGIEEDF